MKILHPATPAPAPAAASAPVERSGDAEDLRDLEALVENLRGQVAVLTRRFEDQSNALRALREMVRHQEETASAPPQAPPAPTVEPAPPEPPARTVSSPIAFAEPSSLWSRLWQYLNESAKGV